MTKERAAQLVARGLMALGLAVGALGICIWAFDIRIDVPPWMWRIAMAKLALAGSVGLLATGAILLRQLRRSTQRGATEPPRELSPPNWEPMVKERERVAHRITTPPT